MKKMSLKKSRELSTNIIGSVFWFPAFFFIAVYVIYSILNTFYLSLLDWNGVEATRQFVGFGNWLELLSDKNFFYSLKNNLVLVVFCIIIQIPFGLFLAYLLDWGGKKLKYLKMLYFLPFLMSSVAIGLLFRQIFESRYGAIRIVFDLLNIKPVNLLSLSSTAIYAVIGVICWEFIPFYMIYFLAGISSQPVEIYEASIIDGAKRYQYIFRISIPMLAGTIKNALIMCMVGSLKYFDLIYVMTEGGPSGSTELMATYMYKNAFTRMKMGYGSTIAAAMFIIITLISVFTFRMMYKENKSKL